MARRQVKVSETVPIGADACWQVLRAFDQPWHPAIEDMESQDGGRLRIFTTKEDGAVYRERLTWLSDSDRTVKYTMVSGIEAAQRYIGVVSVTPASNASCTVEWSAEFEADPARADAIAAGTEAIFQTGIAALPSAKIPPATSAKPPSSGRVEHHQLAGDPSLALSLNTRMVGPSTLCLFLHGIGGGRQNWHDQLTALSGTLPAAALDLRGYGQSSAIKSPSTIEDYFADILAIQTALGAKKLILCGLSYGAWIATSFALHHPNHLEGLILAGGCTGMSEASQEVREGFLNARKAPLLQGQSPADIAPDVLKVIAGPNASQDVHDALHASMAAIPPQTYLDALHCFTSPPERFDFGELKVPVLLVTGAHDKLAPPHEIRGVAKRMHAAGAAPFVRYETLQGAGHVCNLEQPEAFNEILFGFLRSLGP